MIEKKIFSVIVCCHNSEERIGRVLSNIIKQEDLNKLVYEIIIVDNNSKDKTKEIVNEFQKLNNIIHYIFEPKQGLSNARKAGVDSAKGKWIIFLDDDNFIDENWIKKAALYIEKHPKVGAFNGAIIPRLLFNPLKEDILRLESSYKVLACTHMNKKDLIKNPRTPFRNPIGAGLVIKTSPLKILSNNGWLNSSGRTADNLVSGEDGEMAFFIKNNGYEFGFCSKMILYHEIDKRRINDEYLMRMWNEIGKGVAIVIKKNDFFKIKRIIYEILIHTRLLKYKLTSNFKYKYYKNYIYGYHYEIKNK